MKHFGWISRLKALFTRRKTLRSVVRHRYFWKTILPEQLECRTLLTVPVLTSLSGAQNPFNGFDSGEYSVPKLVDLDGDGDLDLVSGDVSGVLKYYKNSGNSTTPAFTLQSGSNDPFNGLSAVAFSLPTLADFDSDGDIDLLFGNYISNFRYFKNTGSSTHPVFTEQTGGNNPFASIQTSNFPFSVVNDLDNDGDLDLVIGLDNGNMLYYKNIGTPSAPLFTEQTGSNNPLPQGFNSGTAQGLTPALADLDADGDSDLIVGYQDGLFFYFRNTGTPESPAFTLVSGAVSNPFYGLDTGYFSAPASGDLDGDGDFDFVVGDASGMFSYLRNDVLASDISLSAASVGENSASGTTVGTFTASVSSYSGSFTYSLISGTGSGDNSSFTIDGAVLKTAALFDYETKSSYSIRVRATDSYGRTVDKVFSITVTNLNESPTAISLSSSSHAENDSNDLTIGTLSSTDPDSGNTFTYSLFAASSGSIDYLHFQVTGGQLSTVASFDYESKSSYSMLVRSTDQDGAYYEQLFTVSVTNVNEAPISASLSATSLPENASVGTLVATILGVDPDPSPSLTYTLVSGTGSTDNASFAISGNKLYAVSTFNYEIQGTCSIRVRVTDQGGLSVEEQLTVGITDQNDTPTQIGLSNSTVNENSPSSTTVGNLSTTDVDSGNTFTYTLVSGTGSTDNNLFAISGQSLVTAVPLDFETQITYSVRIRTTDQGGLFYEDFFLINAVDQNDAPILNSSTVPRIPHRLRGSTSNPGVSLQVVFANTPGLPLIDHDQNSQIGIAVFGGGSNPNGIWQYSLNGGADWNSLAGTSLTSSRLLSPNAKIRFSPSNPKFTGDLLLDFVAWDMTTGTNGGLANITTRGGTTSFSSATNSIRHSILRKPPR